MATTTMSISLDPELRKDIERFAKEDGTSKSLLVRRMVKQAAWERKWDQASKKIHQKCDELGLKTFDDIEAYLG